jgi:hypothetical protein
MFRITIQAVGRNEDEAHIVSDLAAQCFPEAKVIKQSPMLCALEVDEEKASYLIDVLRNAIEDPAFDSFTDWENRKADQYPIVFDTAGQHVEDPIDATCG